MRRPRLSYANVISSLALFVALGGTGYAVSQLPRNSVGTRQLKSNAVTSSKIRPSAVQRSDLAPSARGGARGPRGPGGPTGDTGARGPSETIQIKRPEAVAIPNGAGGTALLASTTVAAGSWMFNGQTRVVYPGSGASEFFDCYLTTTGADRLGEGTLVLGEAQGGVAGSIPTQVAVAFSAPTQVSYVCWHPSAIGGAPRAERTWLLATRIGSLEER